MNPIQKFFSSIMLPFRSRLALRGLAQRCRQMGVIQTSSDQNEIRTIEQTLSALEQILAQTRSEFSQETLARKQAEQALFESEERYTLAVRCANDGMWEWDLKTNRITASPRWMNMLGAGHDHTIATFDDWQRYIHPEDRPQMQAKLKAHVEGHTPHFENEHRIRRQDGKDLWVLSRGSAIRHASGTPYRMIGLDTDITQIKKMQDVFLRIADGTAGTHGEEFFKSMVRNFALALGVNRAFITECLDEPPTRVRMLANWNKNGFATNLEYNLKGTPCDEVINGKQTCFYRSNLPDVFAFEKGIGESYLGMPIFSRTGRVIGHFAFLDTKPMGDAVLIDSIYRIFTARAAAEIEHKRATEAGRKHLLH